MGPLSGTYSIQGGMYWKLYWNVLEFCTLLSLATLLSFFGQNSNICNIFPKHFYACFFFGVYVSHYNHEKTENIEILEHDTD